MTKGMKGQSNHSLDSKGRLIMPAKYREVLGDVVVLGKSVDHCLAVYTKEQWAEFEAQVKKLEDTYFTDLPVRKFAVSAFMKGSVQKIR